jgi:hypothetical protein
MVTPAGFEPAIAGLRTRSPGPLDEGATRAGEGFCACIKPFSEHVGSYDESHKGQTKPTHHLHTAADLVQSSITGATFQRGSSHINHKRLY